MHDRLEASLASTYRLLRRLRRRYHLIRWSAHNRRELARLRANNDSRSRQLADALETSIKRTLPKEEREPIARLERARGRLERSGSTVRRSPGVYPRNHKLAGSPWPVVITVGLAARYSSVHAAWGRLLLALVRATRPAYVLEFGTAIGISGAYISTGLMLDGGGRLITIEADDDLAVQARWLFNMLGLTNIEQRIEWITAEALATICRSAGPLGFVYADALKDAEVVIAMHRHVAAHAAPNAVIVYDDVNWSPEMIEAWRVIQNEPSVTMSIDLDRMGVVVVNGPPVEHSRISLRIH